MTKTSLEHWGFPPDRPQAFYMYLHVSNGSTWMPDHPEYREYHKACKEMFQRIYVHFSDDPNSSFMLK